MISTFLFIFASFAHASPGCPGLEPKPALEALGLLQSENLLGMKTTPAKEAGKPSDVSFKRQETLDQLLDIYNENQVNLTGQLMLSNRILMKFRELDALKIKTRLEETESLQKIANEVMRVKKPTVGLTDHQIQKAIKDDPSFRRFDEMLMSQILRFKELYFSNQTLIEFDMKNSKSRSFIFAVPKPRMLSLNHAFQINALVDEKPYVFQFSDTNPTDKIESSILYIEEITPPAEMANELGNTYRGQKIIFYWAHLVDEKK